MFCQFCGTESTGLNYCNRCGANLNLALAATPTASVNVTWPTLIISVVMLFITCGGMAGVLSAAVELSRSSGGKDVPMAIMFFGMLGIVVIDVLLFSLLWKLINAALSSSRTTKKQASPPQARLPQPMTGQLQPVPASVTENTTRFFNQYIPAGASAEPVPVKKPSDN